MNEATTIGAAEAGRRATAGGRPGAGGPVAPSRDVPRPLAQIHADRHSRRVRIFKIALPLLGLAAVALVAGWTFVKMYFGVALDVRNVLFSKDGLTMVEPRLTGRAQNRTYDVSAARAFQSIGDPKVVRMEEIDGIVTMEDGLSVKIESAGGTYDGNHETLNLAGGVTITASNGWRVEGRAADVDLIGGVITGREAIRISGPGTRLSSDRIDLTDNGHRALFEGTVRMTIVPGETAGATPPAPPR